MWLKRDIKNLRQCFIGYQNTLNFVKNTLLYMVFSTLFSVFGYPNDTLSLMFDILPQRSLVIILARIYIDLHFSCQCVLGSWSYLPGSLKVFEHLQGSSTKFYLLCLLVLVYNTVNRWRQTRKYFVLSYYLQIYSFQMLLHSPPNWSITSYYHLVLMCHQLLIIIVAEFYSIQ